MGKYGYYSGLVIFAPPRVTENVMKIVWFENVIVWLKYRYGGKSLLWCVHSGTVHSGTS